MFPAQSWKDFPAPVSGRADRLQKMGRGLSRARGPCLFRSVPPPVVRSPKIKLIFSARAVPDFAPAQLVPVGIRPPVCSAVSGTFPQANIYSELQFVASVPALALSGRK